MSIAFTILNISLMAIEACQLNNKFKTILQIKFELTYPLCKKDKISAEKIKFIMMEIWRSFVILRIGIVILSILTIIRPPFVILLFSFQIFDLKIVKDAIKDAKNVVFSMGSIIICFIVFLDMGILFFRWNQTS